MSAAVFVAAARVMWRNYNQTPILIHHQSLSVGPSTWMSRNDWKTIAFLFRGELWNFKGVSIYRYFYYHIFWVWPPRSNSGKMKVYREPSSWSTRKRDIKPKLYIASNLFSLDDLFTCFVWCLPAPNITWIMAWKNTPEDSNREPEYATRHPGTFFLIIMTCWLFHGFVTPKMAGYLQGN